MIVNTTLAQIISRVEKKQVQEKELEFPAPASNIS